VRRTIAFCIRKAEAALTSQTGWLMVPHRQHGGLTMEKKQ